MAAVPSTAWRPTRLPWAAVLAGVCLMLLGWAGIERASQLTASTLAGGDVVTAQDRLMRQIAWSVLALPVALFCAAQPWACIRRWASPAYALVLAMLLLVFAMPPVNGAHRWVWLGGISMQPSEPAKLVLVLALGCRLGRRRPARLADLLLPLLLALAPALLILRQPDLGTAAMLVMALGWMLIACHTPWRLLGVLVLCGLCVLPLLWAGMSAEQRSRVTALWRQTLPEERPAAEGYQLHQAKQVLALGGKWGSLLAPAPAADPARRHLPEAHTDFIFVVLAERFGWLGAGGVLLCYMVLVCSLLHAAGWCHDPQARLFVAGVAGLFACQALINTAMAVGLLPIVGLALPLVSYGGSSLITHAAALGLAFAAVRSRGALA